MEQGAVHRDRLLLVELWGIGDLILSTPFLRSVATRYDVVLLGKPHARGILATTFPGIEFIEWDAPWTVFRGKYKFWRWNWRALFNTIGKLRSLGPKLAVSVRKDPRDHVLLWLSGARRRIGFGVYGSQFLLTDSLKASETQHVVEDWLGIAENVVPGRTHANNASVYLKCGSIKKGFRDRANQGLPVLCLHVGARIPVRRWPEIYFADLIRNLRARFQFRLVLVPDLDGYGQSLAKLADESSASLSLEQLIEVISNSDLLISNDSAPAHIAAACATPVIAIFGPTDPARFRPWSEYQHVIIRDICPHRPCFDYCRFPEPFCLTKLQPELIWPELEQCISNWIKKSVLSPDFERAGAEALSESHP